MSKKLWLIPLFVLAAALLWFGTGCDEDDDGPTDSAGSGEIRVYMTDAPALYDSVIVDVQQVSVHIADGDDDDDESGWFVIDDTPQRFDLLELSNGNEAVLAEDELEAGHYSQIRLLLGDGNYLVEDGVQHDLTVPSSQQSGLKLIHGFTIEKDQLYEIMLDFDAARSIHQTGNGQYTLRPTIRVVARSVSGAITGIIVPNTEPTYLFTVTGDDTVGTFADLETGRFVLTALAGGTYSVQVDPVDEAWLEMTIDDVEVDEGETTDLGEIELEAAP